MRVALLKFIYMGETSAVDYPDGYEEQKEEDLYQVKMTNIHHTISGIRGDVFNVVGLLTFCNYGKLNNKFEYEYLYIGYLKLNCSGDTVKKERYQFDKILHDDRYQKAKYTRKRSSNNNEDN